MRTIPLLILLLIGQSGSAQDAPNEKCPVKKVEALYNEGWILKDTVTIQGKDTSDYKLYRRGGGTIFSYQILFDCPQLFDEEYADVLVWSIPDSVSAFTIDLEKDTSNIFFQFSYVLTRFHLVSAFGTLKGVKTNNEWSVTGTGHFIVRQKSSGTTYKRMVEMTGNFKRAGYEGKNKKKQQLAFNNPFFLEN